MKSLISIFIILLSSSVFAAEMELSYMDYTSDVPLVERIVRIRTGVVKANPNVPFKGDIMYLQGLGDSIRNHMPLFTKLSDAGYRVISFDYMGQGGSEGTMNHTRIKATVYSELDIQSIAEEVRQLYQRGDDKLIIMGWSTGGLAAYRLASEGNVKAVILLAPGICAKVSVGSGILRGNKITLPSLTSALKEYELGINNPHLDPIKPESPLVVPLFSSNLLYNAKKSRFWKVDNNVPGILLQGTADSYVSAKCNRRVIAKNASHFRAVLYKDALHELDNEKAEISEKVHEDILLFLRAL